MPGKAQEVVSIEKAREKARETAKQEINERVERILARKDLHPKFRQRLQDEFSLHAHQIMSLDSTTEKIFHLARTDLFTRQWLFELLPPEMFAFYNSSLRAGPEIENQLKHIFANRNLPEELKREYKLKISKQAQELMNLPSAEQRKHRLFVMDETTKRSILELLPSKIALELI